MNNSKVHHSFYVQIRRHDVAAQYNYILSKITFTPSLKRSSFSLVRYHETHYSLTFCQLFLSFSIKLINAIYLKN
jgi:hypothetical protein